ncbi:MAG: mobile mystery protein B [Pseudomonadota bacterium]
MGEWTPIPGETPIDDLSGLKDKSIATRAQLGEAEARNILSATLKYLAAPPTEQMALFDLSWVKKLHAEMFRDVWDWGGKIRRTQTNIGVPPHTIEADLTNLLADLAAWKDSGMPLIEQAVRLHHRAVYIHPFPNGNGRWSRMLADIWLLQHGGKPVGWPVDINGESPIRETYLQALRQADNHDLDPLLALYHQLSSGIGDE